MRKIRPSKVFAFACVFTAIITLAVAELLAFSSAEAASAVHLAVLLQISIYDNSRHLNISGYPADDEATYKTYNNHPLATLADNYYKDTLTRAPALIRYGYFHSFNNYVGNKTSIWRSGKL